MTKMSFDIKDGILWKHSFLSSLDDGFSLAILGPLYFYAQNLIHSYLYPNLRPRIYPRCIILDKSLRSRLAAVTVSLPSINSLDLKGQKDEDEHSLLQGAKKAEKMIAEAYFNSSYLHSFQWRARPHSHTCKAIVEFLPKQDY